MLCPDHNRYHYVRVWVNKYACARVYPCECECARVCVCVRRCMCMLDQRNQKVKEGCLPLLLSTFVFETGSFTELTLRWVTRELL